MALTTGQPVWIAGKSPMLGRLESPKADRSGFVRVSVLAQDDDGNSKLTRGYRAPRGQVFPVLPSRLTLPKDNQRLIPNISTC